MNDQELIRKTIQMIWDLTHVKRFEELDLIFQDIDINTTKTIHVISHLRTSFMWKDELTQWLPLRDRGYNKAIDVHGKPRAARIFVGLLKYK